VSGWGGGGVKLSGLLVASVYIYHTELSGCSTKSWLCPPQVFLATRQPCSMPSNEQYAVDVHDTMLECSIGKIAAPLDIRGSSVYVSPEGPFLADVWHLMFDFDYFNPQSICQRFADESFVRLLIKVG